jgi:hypothetical protein
MTPQDWESPAAVGAAPSGGSEMAAAYALRPLSTGEVLDRTFSIYRSRFWLFAGISSLSGAVQLMANALNLLVQHMVTRRYGFRTAALESSVGAMVGALLFVIAAAITQAATVYALSEVYLGRSATVGDSIRWTLKLWYRYLGIALWQIWSAMWLGLLLAVPALIFVVPQFGLTSFVWASGLIVFLAVFGGGAYGVIAYLRNSLAVQAAVVEQSKVRASMRRSKNLTSGTKGRIFVVFLIAVALFYVGAAIQAPMAFFIVRSPLQPHVMAQAAILTIGFVTHTVVSPVALIGLSLVYFDQRVRKEAFDLVMLLGGETPAAVVVSAVEPVVAPVVVEAPVVGSTEGVHHADASIGNDGQG